jgi:hypothetical protein
MARCACPQAFPIAECTTCAPPMLFAPVVPPNAADPYGVVLDETPPPVVITIALGGVTVAAVVVLGGVAAAAWAVGAVIDAIRGRT